MDKAKAICILLVGILIALIPVAICNDTTYTVTETVDVWVTNAPFGVYWTSGAGNILFYTAWTSEVYIVKYVTNTGEVKTVSFGAESSTAKVFFTDDNTTMTLTMSQEYEEFFWYTHAKGYGYTYTLYIPKPDIVPEGWYGGDI